MTTKFVFLAVCAAFLASTCLAKENGRLIVRRSANFGTNMVLQLAIDGQHAGNVSIGHIYDQPISAGPHILTVNYVPNVRHFAPTSTRLNVNQGGVYAFTAMWTQDQHVILRPNR